MHASSAHASADLDHTADVQCHSWGATMKAAFENMAPCMFNYMTDLAKVQEDPEEVFELKIEGVCALCGWVGKFSRSLRACHQPV